MSKQDRQGVRTPADLERKYNFGKNFGEVMGYARTAENAAARASEAASNAAQATQNLDDKLDQDEILDRLTNDTGVITSADGTVSIDLVNNKVTIATLVDGHIGKIEMDASGIHGYGWDEANETYLDTMSIDPSEGLIQCNGFKVGDKTAEWKDNGDGTFTMIGR